MAQSSKDEWGWDVSDIIREFARGLITHAPVILIILACLAAGAMSRDFISLASLIDHGPPATAVAPVEPAAQPDQSDQRWSQFRTASDARVQQHYLCTDTQYRSEHPTICSEAERQVGDAVAANPRSN